MAPRHHTLDIYDTELHLATNRRDWATLRRRFGFLRKEPGAEGRVHSAVWVPKAGPTRQHIVIWIDLAKHDGRPGGLVNSCAHEATHAAGDILEQIGHDKAGDEPHAYLVGWLTEWIWQHCQT